MTKQGTITENTIISIFELDGDSSAESWRWWIFLRSNQILRILAYIQGRNLRTVTNVRG